MAEQRGKDVEAGKGGQREIGATAGKTHEQVLDEVIGPERRRRNETQEG